MLNSKFWLILPLLLLLAAPAWGAAAYVQECTNTVAAGDTTITCTFSGAVSSGNAVVGFLSVGSNSPSRITSVTDDQANSYSLVDDTIDDTHNKQLESFYLCNITNGPTVITGNLASSTGARVIMAYEVSGIATSSCLDQHIGQYQSSPGTGTDAVTSTAVVTTADGDFVMGGTTNSLTSNFATDFTKGTGYTAITIIGDTSTTRAAAIEYVVQSSAGSIAGTFTIATNHSQITNVVALKAAGGAPPAHVRQMRGLLGVGQ